MASKRFLSSCDEEDNEVEERRRKKIGEKPKRKNQGEKKKLKPPRTPIENEEDLKMRSLSILTAKEQRVEEFMIDFLESFQKKNGTDLGFSGDLTFQEKIKKAEKEMNECSMILAHKYHPIIREIFAQEEMKEMEDQYGVIKSDPINEKDRSAQYRDCFLHYLHDEENVSLKTANLDLLGNISIRDYFTLVFWAMNTVKRQTGDNLLQLIVCGKTSCGKSAIFENPLQQISHNMTTDQGVGRFLTKSKSTLLLHDCNLEILVRGKDVDKLKSITRTEPIMVKTFGKTEVVPNMHVMVTSNKHIYLHRFRTPKVEGFCSRTIYKSDIEASKTIHAEDVEAVRNRYIECFVRDRPVLPAGALPTCGNFEREHLIKGLFTYIIDILQRYEKKDFHGDYLYLYAIIGLCKNLYRMDEEDHMPLGHTIIDLFVNKFQFSSDQKMTCFTQFGSQNVKGESD